MNPVDVPINANVRNFSLNQYWNPQSLHNCFELVKIILGALGILLGLMLIIGMLSMIPVLLDIRRGYKAVKSGTRKGIKAAKDTAALARQKYAEARVQAMSTLQDAKGFINDASLDGKDELVIVQGRAKEQLEKAREAGKKNIGIAATKAVPFLDNIASTATYSFGNNTSPITQGLASAAANLALTTAKAYSPAYSTTPDDALNTLKNGFKGAADGLSQGIKTAFNPNVIRPAGADALTTIKNQMKNAIANAAQAAAKASTNNNSNTYTTYSRPATTTIYTAPAASTTTYVTQAPASTTTTYTSTAKAPAASTTTYIAPAPAATTTTTYTAAAPAGSSTTTTYSASAPTATTYTYSAPAGSATTTTYSASAPASTSYTFSASAPAASSATTFNPALANFLSSASAINNYLASGSTGGYSYSAPASANASFATGAGSSLSPIGIAASLANNGYQNAGKLFGFR